MRNIWYSLMKDLVFIKGVNIMNNVVDVRGIKIGDGIPKICVPIVGKNMTDIFNSAKSLSEIKHDLVEWRVDWFENSVDSIELLSVLTGLRNFLGDTPLLFTFRTAAEGGETEIDKETYFKINLNAIETGLIDLIDVELYMGEDLVTQLVEAAHERDIKVVLSNHDFERTPAKKEIISRLQRMQNLGADISKIAVMPSDKTDVLTLLSATEEMFNTYASTPIVTMSMGKLGVLSRVCGEFFGSAISFGTVGNASAPGQIPADELSDVLQKMHGLL